VFPVRYELNFFIFYLEEIHTENLAAPRAAASATAENPESRSVCTGSQFD
jgi:hypothetical protein